MAPKKAALIELYDSHDELLYSQALFLRSGGYELSLIVSEAHRTTVSAFDGVQDIAYTKCSSKKGLALWRELLGVRSLLLRKGIDLVIFNTAHGNIVRNFCMLPFPGHIKFFGTLHGVNKLKGSLTQRLISRKIKKYFLLNDYMREKALKMPHDGLRFGVYYPIFHPHLQPALTPAKPPGQLWICIPGHVEFKRRDYISLVNALATIEDKPFVRFIILGNGAHPHGNGPELKSMVAQQGLGDYFQFFDGFVSNELFHAWLQKCDAVLPLTHPINAALQKYAEDQISGSFNLAFAWRKPLLMHEYYQRYQDFRENALFYELEKLDQFLRQLPESLSNSHGFYHSSKWTLEAQSRDYLSFIETGATLVNSSATL